MKTRRRKRGAFNLAAIRRGEIERHARCIAAADTDDFWRWLSAWVWHNDKNVHDPVGALQLAAERMGGALTEAETILERADEMHQQRNADRLARFLRITYAQRQWLGITTIGSTDVSRRARALLRKHRDRRRKERKRRERGIRPLAQALSRTKPWAAEGVSRRTWYRKRGTTASAAIPPLESGGTNGTTASAAIFLSADDALASPERKKGAFRGGACGEGHGEHSSTHSALREESVSVDDPGCGWLRSRFVGVRWPRPGHEAACGRFQCAVCEPAHHKQEAAE
jgi:hypothetical protein